MRRFLLLLACTALAGAACKKDEEPTCPAAPTALAVTARTTTSITLEWTPGTNPADCTVSGYRVYDGDDELAAPTSPTVELTGLPPNTEFTFTVAAVNERGASARSEAVTTATDPDLGPNTLVFDPSMQMSAIQADIDEVYAPQFSDTTGQFNSNRWALLFKPGVYEVNVPIGYYMQVLGLGALPDDTRITGMVTSYGHWSGDWGGSGYNATQNFWRGIENLNVMPTPNVGALPTGEDDGDVYMRWAVSQASPFRRMHVSGDIQLHHWGGWSSGGWMSDSKIDGVVGSGSQQQWFARNSNIGEWSNVNWNMVFMAVDHPFISAWPNTRSTVFDTTPVVREKPFLYVDDAGRYRVFVPALLKDVPAGTTWSSTTQSPGTSLPLSDFFVARPSDEVADVNAALAAGRHVLFTPGIYHLDGTVEVTRPGTVVLGIGLATLHPDTGLPAMTIADVDGVVVAGLLFDAGVVNSPVLLEVGAAGASADHSDDPISLHDLIFRVGGAEAGKADVCMIVHSDDVIGDHFWIWRADHGAGVGWDENPSRNGLVVNGDDVTIYGLFVEHFEEYQTIWNGERGRVYFYQSEIPYDVPNQADWMSHGGTRNGWASYKVADTVTDHEAWGLGVYSVFMPQYWDEGVTTIDLHTAIEVPDVEGVKMHHMITFGLANGTITHVINEAGGSATSNPWAQGIVVEYPEPPPVEGDPLVVPLDFEPTPNAVYQFPNWGGAVAILAADPTNASNHVAQFFKGAAAETWAGFAIDEDTAAQSSLAQNAFATSTTWSMRARCNRPDVVIRFKIEAPGGNPFVELDQTTGAADTWQTLTYAFTGVNESADYRRPVVFPGFGSRLNVTCWLDDLGPVAP
ncbi:MAG TPA: fibronectin type III domain-containing protein [Anaeromyxobacter sp.]|nr:fibronectin type III domain-containing protein [Anaeromyxobacter sp.]